MRGQGTTALIAALALFAVYFGNVASGAAGAGVFLGDVAEMLMLLASVTLFVIGILLREAAARRDGE